MVTADWVILIGALVFLVLGWLVGFGKGLKFFTKGIFGIIISVFFCYVFGGMILKLSFIQKILDAFIGAITDKGSFCDFLINIHIDIILYYIVLFIVAQLVRLVIVLILGSVVEIDNVVMKIINRTLGLIFFFGVFFILTLFAFQIVAWIGGDTAEDFVAHLSRGKLGLGSLYNHNPLLAIVERVKALAS